MIETDSPDIIHRPLHEITAEFGESGLLHRLNSEIESTDWDSSMKQLVFQARDTALGAHADDARGEQPYSTHFLRVAIRILSRDHLAVRDQPELIIAALLHDTVEDHPEEYLEADDITIDKPINQGLALAEISHRYGELVMQLVAAVTNPDFPPHLSKLAKNELYRQHVRELLVRDPLASIIKLSDFIDNCVGLIHSESSQKALSMATKYIDLIPPMIAFVQSSELLTNPVQARVVQQLETALQRCQTLIWPI